MVTFPEKIIEIIKRKLHNSYVTFILFASLLQLLFIMNKSCNKEAN